MKENLGKRKQGRTRAVLPVRVRAKDSSGALFESIAHTLDLTHVGARLGAIRREVKAKETLVVLFRKRRIEFTVMWSRMLDPNEYQVGLQLVAGEGDPWGLSQASINVAQFAGASATSGAA